MAHPKTITGSLPKYAGATLSFLLRHNDESLKPTEEMADSVSIASDGSFSFAVSELTRGNFEVLALDEHGVLGFVGRVNILLDMPGTYPISSGTTPQANCLRDEMQEIDAVLSSGVDSITIDGTTTHYNLDSLRQRRRELQEQLRKLSAYERARRPVAASIYLGGF